MKLRANIEPLSITLVDVIRSVISRFTVVAFSFTLGNFGLLSAPISNVASRELPVYRKISDQCGSSFASIIRFRTFRGVSVNVSKLLDANSNIAFNVGSLATGLTRRNPNP